MTTQREEGEGVPLRGYLRVLRQWMWVVIGLLIVGVAAGAMWSLTRQEVYTAAAELLYQRSIDISNPLGQTYLDTSERQAELESIPGVIDSAEVRVKADEKLGSTAGADYSVSVELEPGIDDTYTNVVTVLGSAPTPDQAAKVANAYAEGFIEWRAENSARQIDEAIAVVEKQLEEFDTPAERRTSDYANLQSLLEDLKLLKATAGSGFRVIQAASPPSEPSSPNFTRDVALGGALGLVAGLIAAFVAAQLDTRVHDEEQIAAILGQPLLSRVPALNGDDENSGALIMLSDPTGPRAEAYRVLRSNLDLVDVDDGMRSLLISSSMQGEHKSVTASNLAVAMALAGRRVILVDADLRSPRVHAYMTLGNAAGVSTVVAGGATLSEALKRIVLQLTTDARRPAAGGDGAEERRPGADAGPGSGPTDETETPVETLTAISSRAECAPEGCPVGMWDGAPPGSALLYVLTSGPLPPNPGEMVSSRRFRLLVDELSKHCDLLIVDAPAMLVVGDTAATANSVDAVLYVVDPRVAKRRDLEEAARQLGHLPCRKIGFVMVTEKSASTYYGYEGYAGHAHEGRRGRRRRRS